MNTCSSNLAIIRNYVQARKNGDERRVAQTLRELAAAYNGVFAQMRALQGPVSACGAVYDEEQMQTFFVRAVYETLESHLRENGMTLAGFGMRLFLTTKRVFGEELRYCSVSNNDQTPVPIEKSLDVTDRTQTTPAENVEGTNMQTTVRTFLESLPRLERKILKKYVNGRSDATIANEIGVSRGFIQARRTRTFEQLRKLLLGSM